MWNNPNTPTWWVDWNNTTATINWVTEKFSNDLTESIQYRFPIKENIESPESIEKIKNAFSFYKNDILPLIINNSNVTQQKEWYHGLYTHTQNVVFRGICYAISLGENPIPVVFACACHDLARKNNAYDTEHWKNAVPIAKEIMNNEKFSLTEEEKNQIIDAIANHTEWKQALNYVSACLWDADRTRLSWERWYREDFFNTEQWKKIASWKRQDFLKFQNLCIGLDWNIKWSTTTVNDSNNIPDMLKSDYSIDKEKKNEYKKLLSYFKFFIFHPDIERVPSWPSTRQEVFEKIIDNFPKNLYDREFVDCLVEMDETNYERLRKHVDIPSKITHLREKYETFRWYVKIIKDYRSEYTKHNSPDCIEIIKDKLNDPIFRYIVTYMTDNRLFNNLENDICLPNEIKMSRDAYNKYILENIDNQDIVKIQDSLCDLLFSDNAQNIKLHIGVISDRMEYVSDFLDDNNKKIFDLIYSFINLNWMEDGVSKKEVKDLVKKITIEDEKLKNWWLSLKKRLINIINKAQTDFENDLKSSIAQIDFSVESHQTLKSQSWWLVNFYEINDLNDDEFFLVRSVQFKWKPSGWSFDSQWRLDKEKYWQFLEKNKKDGCSYSVINCNSTKKNVFNAHDDTVLFWFLWFWDNKVKTANTFDSGSGPIPWVFRYKQQFIPLKEFLSQTEGHNEIMISNEKSLYPDYIISRDNPPRQEQIDLAYEFWIPIIHFQSDKTVEQSKPRFSSVNAWKYDYFSFGSDRFVSPKCKPVESISKLLKQFKTS